MAMPSDRFIFEDEWPSPSAGRTAMTEAWHADETARVEALLEEVDLPPVARQRIRERASVLVERVREEAENADSIDAFMQEYDLSSREGIALMCLAEALLRIPDADTADRLIADKLLDAHWEDHLGHSDSLFVNASTWALMLTGRIMRPDPDRDLGAALRGLLARGSRPVVRQAVVQAMRIMGHQFVMGRTIEEAKERAREDRRKGYRHSFDMLGEGARTAADAERYFRSYLNAIEALDGRDGSVFAAPGISVKLSALHPRYVYAKRRRVLAELAPRLTELARAAKRRGIGLTVDAEEADRLDLSLDVFEAVYRDDGLEGWEGLGLAVQAYQKRAPFVIDWIAALSKAVGRRIPVRLVKGAYWDTEIKRAQVAGLEGYPVFTRKVSTDLSFLVCARRLLAAGKAVYPQFATHNAHTIAAVLEMAEESREFEFQRLHGMGEALHDILVASSREGGFGLPSRIYAPVGGHEDLLAYLVRRLLENGANTSFVNRIVHQEMPVSEIVADPVARAEEAEPKPHPGIPLPSALYGDDRRNARGLELADPAVLTELASRLKDASRAEWSAAPLVGGHEGDGELREVRDPSDRRRIVGIVRDAGADDVARAVDHAVGAAPGWDRVPAEERAAILRKAADLMEARLHELIYLCIREAGKTVAAALADVREAVDFFRYYALRASVDYGERRPLQGPTGEENRLRLHGRGVFACISPWNFPVAIFTGQTAAALAAGNAVVAKPAEQTSLAAAAIVRLLHEAGLPADVLSLLPGPGETVGAALVADPRIAGVAFTGSVEAAHAINRQLAERRGAIVPLIAETGGQNAMIVDSSALPEQVVDDAVYSAFDSAGQRCSALRVLFVQDDVAPRLIEMLTGAMEELTVDDPGLISTDVGPAIDEDARSGLLKHIDRMKREARLLHAGTLGPETEHGSFVAPHAFEIDDMARLEREVFGPVLHVVRYRGEDLDRVVDAVNATGYGLTLGIHSRVESTVRSILARARVGNAYVNRNMIGAVVGVQPFGGEGLSGTGPKAGGPHYLPRFGTERVVSINTTASGGNAALLALED